MSPYRLSLVVASLVLFASGALGQAQQQNLVFRLESFLLELGYQPGAVDGVVDEATHEAIRTYQRDRGLTPTGGMTMPEYQALEAEIVQHRALAQAKPQQPTLFQPNATPAAPTGQAQATAIPRYLQDGTFSCWNVTRTPDQASCSQLIKEMLVANKCGYAENPADDATKARIRMRVSMEHCFKANFNSRVNRRPIVAAVQTFRKNKIAALNARPLDQNTQTRRFMVGNEPFDVPTAHERKIFGSGVYRYSGGLKIWTNFQPLTPCPSPTAYIVVEHTGQDAFHQWSYDSGAELDFVRTISKTIRQDNARPCVGAREYQIAVHAFDNDEYIGSTVVPFEEIRRDEYGTGADFLFANFVPAIAQYARSE